MSVRIWQFDFFNLILCMGFVSAIHVIAQTKQHLQSFAEKNIPKLKTTRIGLYLMKLLALN